MQASKHATLFVCPVPGASRTKGRGAIRYSKTMSSADTSPDSIPDATINKYPNTPDGRYFIVKDRLWRTSNPQLAPDARQALVDQLMRARRQVGIAKRAGDAVAERSARADVDAAKRGLGERGPVWWLDGAPDFNRRLVANTPYADWYAGLAPEAGT
jgi:hypothetical protein